MLTALLVRLVHFATRRAWSVIAAALLLSAASAAYVTAHFAIDTDIDHLLDSTAPWAMRDAAIGAAFPQRRQLILAVLQAPTREQADAAADALAGALRRQPQTFRTVDQPGGGDFFARAGLLFLPRAALAQLATQLQQARPLINTLAHDPTLRGLADALATILGLPLQSGQVTLDDLAPVLNRSAAVLELVQAGKPAALSWSAWAADATHADATQMTRGAGSFVTVSPVLDYGNLEAGAGASAAIRATAVRLGLQQRYGATVRLTGEQPLADEEFASVAQGAALNGALTLLLFLLILWLALRDVRLIAAVLLNLFAGLIITAALGLAMVHALNMISVAFAVLFVGLGGDFGIQFGVRYRAERHAHDNLPDALLRTARAAGLPLALAAAATAVAFFSFLPTDYRGVAELGQIAGVGMVVAFATTLTLLPALIRVLRPGAEAQAQAPAMRWLAPADHFFERHRQGVLLLSCIAIVAAAPLLPHLRFDFDPLHLKDPRSESMATLRALADSPQAGTDDVSVLAPTPAAARTIVARLAALPEVARVVTLQIFIPDDQPAKLAIIAAMASSLGPALNQTPSGPASDALRVAALQRLADQLELAAEDHPGRGAGPASANRLAKTLRRLAAPTLDSAGTNSGAGAAAGAGANARAGAGAGTAAGAALRDRAEQALAQPLQLTLAQLRRGLQAQPVDQHSLPPALLRDWLTPDGRALVSISPRLPPTDSANRPVALQRFLDAVLRAEPTAAGGPISVRGSADTIMRAFAQAGGWAVLAITALLWITLRRFADVLRTLVPLLVSTVVTLELCVAFGLPLNFANVIALPLLLGVGVAFKIYYVMAWRAGQTHLLQSSLTHAVLYSAATTAAAFGSLSLSHHPGTASMGQLLALALACTLVGAVFFQPILLGRPRQEATPADSTDSTDGLS
ncbi:MMPL family transporter [Rugamonas sp.]|uniref:MMPL family transporter n=1 Tax=Rugamonas sp. TaxID=1926287 RepID=UPI0025F6683F|nr:MMPL family transporter [Rugamonas sp.]